MDGWSVEIRIQVVTAVLATVGMVAAFWLGSSFGSQKKDAAIVR
jgi:flagellar basal body-associated protein FliL